MINPENAPAAAEMAHELRNEFVVRARGAVVRRAPETVNPAMATGEIEIQASELEILSRSTPLPFQLDEEGVDETLRIRYRWLDLRRDEDAAQHPHARRSSSRSSAREMEARRLRRHRDADHGQADARGRARLPRARRACSRAASSRCRSAPQIYKQLLVISGFERYYQIARCFRDEDLRADRLQEITQLDVEMAFPDQEFLFGLMERMIVARSGASASGSSSRRRSRG